MKEVEQFIKSYMRILLESWKNDVLIPENMISKPLSLSQLDELLKNMIIVDPENDDIEILYDPDDPSLFTESKYFHDIVDIILNARNGEIFWQDRIIGFINSKWIFYDELRKNVKPFYVFRFDFNDTDAMARIIRMYMGAFDEDIVNEYVKKFIKRLTNSAAAYSSSDGSNSFRAFFINEGSSNSKNHVVGLHEFTHYLQDVLGIYKVEKDINIGDVEASRLSFLELTDEEKSGLEQTLSKNEIWPYVNEVIFALSKVYEDDMKLVKGLSPSLFVEYAITKLSSKDIYKSDLYREIQKYLPKYANPLYVFVACIVLDIEKDKIINALKEELESDET